MTTPPGAPTSPLPLVALLGAAKEAFTAEFDRRIRESTMCALSLAHANNVLRHLANGPLRASAIVDRCGVTKQAVSQQIAHLQRNGYVYVAQDPDDQRARIVELTTRGREAQCLVIRLFAEIEREWITRIGEDNARILRDALGTLGEGHHPVEGCG